MQVEAKQVRIERIDLLSKVLWLISFPRPSLPI